MRLVLSLIALTSIVLPLAAGHTIVCAPDPMTGECTAYAVPGPHAATWVTPCGPCVHSQPALALDRDVLP